MNFSTKDIVCLDIETTGINKYKDEILQIAIINGNYETLFYSCIKPRFHRQWIEAQAVNHISPQMVKYAPALDDVKDEIISILNRAKLIVGYNHERFDIPFIEFQMNKKIVSKVCDVMKLFKLYSGNNKSQKLSLCCETLNVKNKNEHDSLGDVKATLECFYKLMQFAN